MAHLEMGSGAFWLAVWYAAWSLLCFVAYARDKAAARFGAHRTSENALHGLALLGGWPGAWLAQQALRHKSVKTTFRRVFWLTVMLNVFILYLLTHSPAQVFMLL